MRTFILIKNITDKLVDFEWNGKRKSVSLGVFLEKWSGIILVAEVDENSIEPNYYKNKKKEELDKIQSVSLYVLLILMGGFLLVNSGLWKNINGITVALLLLGICVCYLLLKKQLHIQSDYADKLCSVFAKSNCNDVLESRAARFGIFTWSEIGLGYFVATIIIYLCMPFLIPYCAWLAVFALPYSLWSIGYQYLKAKNWCPMCLFVMTIFWLMFIVNLYIGNLSVFPAKWISFIGIGVLYLSMFLIVHKCVSVLADSLLKQQLESEISRIKLNKDVFTALLKKNKHYDVQKSTSQIMFGNKMAPNMITVLTNPYCGPCANMHIRIREFLKKVPNRYCIQYIFAPFDSTLYTSVKMLISSYLKDGATKSAELYDKWFKYGKYEERIFFQKEKLSQNESVEEEFEKHKRWISESMLHTTPTILINGYVLPEEYKLEDLEWIEI